METLFPIWLFIVGTIFGSFCIVVGLRLPKGESVVHPSSRCLRCGTRLRPVELIPVFSWVLLKGRCRTCRAPISPLLPLVELAVGGLFAAVNLVFGHSAETVMGLLFVSMLAIVTVSDLAHRLIPDRITLPFLALFFVMRWFIHPDYPIWVHLAGMAAGFLLFFLLAVLSRGGVGGGDIKLYAVVGLFLGLPPLLMTIFLSSLFGMMYGLCLMLIRRKWRGIGIPYGPFIAAGALLAYLGEDGFLEWYGSLWQN